MSLVQNPTAPGMNTHEHCAVLLSQNAVFARRGDRMIREWILGKLLHTNNSSEPARVSLSLNSSTRDNQYDDERWRSDMSRLP